MLRDPLRGLRVVQWAAGHAAWVVGRDRVVGGQVDGIADDLAADYTVASYDPRGMSRSPLDDPQAPQRVAQHADDAFQLLELLSPDAPARVAGCSSGAIVVLHLLAVHPERIARAVAHEPPVVEVLPDAAEHRALLARVQDTFRRDGLMPAV